MPFWVYFYCYLLSTFCYEEIRDDYSLSFYQFIGHILSYLSCLMVILIAYDFVSFDIEALISTLCLFFYFSWLLVKLKQSTNKSGKISKSQIKSMIGVFIPFLYFYWKAMSNTFRFNRISTFLQ